MASAIAKYGANKMLKGELKKYADKAVGGNTDPYFTYTEDPRTGKKKKQKKLIPSYIPEHDALVLAKMRKRAYRLDMSLFSLGGIRFGWSSVIGIIPGVGDVADSLMAFSLASRCRKVEGGLPDSVYYNMLINILLDFVIGLVPILGDLLDGWFKANTRNVRVLENYLDKKYKPAELTAREKNMSKGSRPPPATTFEDYEDDNALLGQQNVQSQVHRQPAPTTVPQDGGARSGWFSSMRGGSKQERDVERGVQPVRVQETGTVVNGGR